MIPQYNVLLVLLVLLLVVIVSVDVYKTRTGSINTKSLAWAEKNLRKHLIITKLIPAVLITPVIEELAFRYPLLLTRNIVWLWVPALIILSTWIFGILHWVAPRYIPLNPKRIRRELDLDPVYRKLGSEYITLEDAVALHRSRIRGNADYEDTYAKAYKLSRVYVGSAVALGFVLGVVVLVTNSILPAIGIHALANLIMKRSILST